MSLYRLPHGQYGYSGHVINLPQDVASFANSLPRPPGELDIMVTNNIYYHHVSINPHTLALLPEDDNISGLCSVTLESSDDGKKWSSTTQDEDPYDAHLTRTLVPIPNNSLTV